MSALGGLRGLLRRRQKSPQAVPYSVDGCMMRSTAPVVSATIANRPYGVSAGGSRIDPPSSVTLATLSSTFADESRMKVQLPAASNQPQMTGSGERIVVTVTELGGYRVNERELVNSSRETLRAAVLAVAGESRTDRVVLRADARATHQSVVTAMDVLGKMGFQQLDVATVQPPPTT